MTVQYSSSAIGILVFVFFCAAAIAGFAWLLFPSWLGRKLGAGKSKDTLEMEEGYRKALSQILGFPIAIFGLVGAFLTVAKGLDAYNTAVLADFQERYRRGFDMLASAEAATRIGGLYVLEALIKQNAIDSRAGDGAKTLQLQQNTILQSIAAFAVDHSLTSRPGSDDPIVVQEALIALRIVGESNASNADRPVNLRGGYFVGGFIPHATLDHVNLYGANFAGSDIYQGHLFEANLRNVRFDGSNLTDVDFSHAGFLNTTFCSGKNYATADLIHDQPVNTRMVNTKFYNVSGDHVFFTGAIMQKSVFNNSALVTADFVSADLEDATFLSANLNVADFTKANMQRVSFGKDQASTQIQDSSFDQANVSFGHFEYASIIRVSFRNTVLKNAHFDNAVIDADFSGADLSGATFENAKFVKANFNGAFLKNTILKGAQYSPSMLYGAIACDNTNGVATTDMRCAAIEAATKAPTSAISVKPCMQSGVVRPPSVQIKPK